jgi:hypothetical protein
MMRTKIIVPLSSLFLYRERKKQYPALPKRREGVHYARTQMDTKTSRDEEFLLVNNEESGTIIFVRIIFGLVPRI